MSLITPNNVRVSQSVGCTRVDSLNSKARFNDNGQKDEECSQRHKLSTLQVANIEGNADQSTTQEDDHEHPCVCDLRLPRQTLNSEERYAKAKDYLRNESKTNGNSSQMAKSFHLSQNLSPKKSSTMSSDIESKIDAALKSTKLKIASSKKTTKKSKNGKDEENNEKNKKMKKEIDSSDYEYQMLSEGDRAEERKTKSIGKKGDKSDQNPKAASARFKLTGGESSAADEENNASPRKNIRWKRKPQIAVKMNRTANLRLEKGQQYCGGILTRFKGMSKVEEYFANRGKRIAAARAKAKAEAADAEAERSKNAGGADDGIGGSGSTSREDEMASQKCEYMRCFRDAQK